MRRSNGLLAALALVACGGGASGKQPTATGPVPAPATNLEEQRQQPPTPIEAKPGDAADGAPATPPPPAR